VIEAIKALHILYSGPPVTVPVQMPPLFQAKEIAVTPNETTEIRK
jgi:hypothetical protein